MPCPCRRDSDYGELGFKLQFAASRCSLLFWRKHHHHLPAFHHRVLLDHCMRCKVFLNPTQKLTTDLLVRHFTATEPQGYLGLVSFFEKANQVSQLHLIV